MARNTQRRFWAVQASYNELATPDDPDDQRTVFTAGTRVELPLESSRATVIDAAKNEYARAQLVNGAKDLVVSITSRDEFAKAWIEAGQFRSTRDSGPVLIWESAA